MLDLFGASRFFGGRHNNVVIALRNAPSMINDNEDTNAFFKIFPAPMFLLSAFASIYLSVEFGCLVAIICLSTVDIIKLDC